MSEIERTDLWKVRSTIRKRTVMNPVDAAHHVIALEAEVVDLRRENAMLRLAFCDEAYIIAAQTLDVKALGKGRRRILANQALRMALVGLNEGFPRHTRETDEGLQRRARELAAELAVVTTVATT